MKKVAVVYWSGTGNTEAMANAVVEGIRTAGAEADLFTASSFGAGKMDEYDAVAFGCPSMGVEQLEDSEFEPMFQDCESKLSGKKIALFGESHVDEAAAANGLKVLAKLPIDPAVAKAADSGVIELFEGDWLDGAADLIESL